MCHEVRLGHFGGCWFSCVSRRVFPVPCANWTSSNLEPITTHQQLEIPSMFLIAE